MKVRAYVSKSARARIEIAKRFLVERAGPRLVIGPSRAALDELALEVTAERGASFGIHRKTLMGLATETAALHLATHGRTPARRVVLDAIARQVARAAFEAGELGFFGRTPSGRGAPGRVAVASTPGFALSLARTLDELDRDGVDPDALSSTSPAGADLARLARRMNEALRARGLASRADTLRAAAEELDKSPLAGLPVVIFDLSLRSKSELDLVRALLASSADAVFVVHQDDTRTVAMLEQLGIQAEAVEPHHDDLAIAQARIFGEAVASEAPAPLEASIVTLRSAPTEALEAVEIARAVLDEARRGVAFDEMAVVVRSRDLYAAHLETALARAEIPAVFEAGTRRPHPAGRALLALIACKLERGSGRRLFEYLSTGQLPGVVAEAPPIVAATADEDLGRFSPEQEPTEDMAPEEDVEAAAPDGEAPKRRRPPLRRWLRILGEAGISRAGRDASVAGYVARRVNVARQELLASRAAAAWDEAEAADEEDVPRATARIDRELADLEELERGLGPVLAALDALPMTGTPTVILASLRNLATLGLRRTELVLALLAELEVLASPTEVELEEIVAILAPRLRLLERTVGRASQAGTAAVVVTTTEGIRGRSRKVVFVPGLAEGIFPLRTREDPLLLDEHRAGLGLRGMGERMLDERLSLSLAAGAATERLRFSYPKIEAETGRPRVPSVYALEVARAIAGSVPSLSELEATSLPPSRVMLAWPAPRSPELAVDELEYTLAIVRSERARSGGPRKGGARFLIERHPLLWRALRARWQRHDSPHLSSWDGLAISSLELKRSLGRYRLSERPYSPSSLEAFAACPYRFYLRAIARLAPREEVAPVDRLDNRVYGQIYHRCQALLASRIMALELDAQDPANRPRLIGEIREVVQSVAEERKRVLEPVVPRIFDDEMERIHRDLMGWLDHENTKRDGFRPFRAELSFGLPRHDTLSPESVREEACIAGGYRLRGAIDVIERDASGRLRVTDYKTGSFPDERKRPYLTVGGGEVLQPLLYALAVKSLRGSAVPESSVVTSSRLYYATRRGGYEQMPVDATPANEAQALRVLDAIDGAIFAGTFPALPRAGACAACSYRTVCGPNEEARTKKKIPGAARERTLVESLVEIRGMP